MAIIRIVRQDDLTADDRTRLFERRHRLDDIHAAVRDIVAQVRQDGDAAVIRLTERLDGVTLASLSVTADEFAEAEGAVDPLVREALEAQIRAVRAFHAPQIPAEQVIETAPGIRAWREWRPIERVGLYVPGGRGPYPSSVVMLGVPASIAGCPEVYMCTPPGPDGRIPASTLVAAQLIGVRHVFKVGGAQAVAAMAYGTETIPRVDKIFGAGNAYVTAAKLECFPDCMLDAPAGPSELVIIADAAADAGWIAADLLSDVEHGPDSPAVLFTSSEAQAAAVASELERQVQTLPRQDVARRALDAWGLIVVTDTLGDAVRLADAYAPEHLEIVTEHPREVLREISNAGSIFLGPHAPNAAGDYATGTNHVLPTALYARTLGPVSVESFGRLVQCQELTLEGLAQISGTVTKLAREEGLEAHARAVEIRLDVME